MSTHSIVQCTSCLRQALPGKTICFDCDRDLNKIVGTVRPKLQDMPLSGRIDEERHRRSDRSMSEKYPKYYKKIPAGVTELDVYGVCAMFPVDDSSGAINHARKKLLVPGVRTGGKSMVDDVREAVDTLNRWLQMQPK